MSTVGQDPGAAGLATGIIGAAVFGGVTAQRMAVKRYRSALTDLTREELLGELTPDRTYSVAAEDGVVLHVEEVGPVNAPLTIIFAHGWTLRSGSWHFQRLGLAGPGFGTGEPGVAGDPDGVLRPSLARQVDPRARRALHHGVPGLRPAARDRDRGAGRARSCWSATRWAGWPS